MKQDIKIWLMGFALVVGLIAVRPATAWNSLTEKLQLSNQDVANYVATNFPLNKAEMTFWSDVKGVEVEIPTGGMPQQENLMAIKLDQRGLVTDENGEIIRKEDVGKIKAPFKFMIIGGSSMLEGLGPRMEKDIYAKIPKMQVLRFGKYSSGLNRIDFYNWTAQAKKLINQHKPQIIITQHGGNDGQPIADSNGVKYPMTDRRWDNIYRQRVDDFLRVVSQVKKVYLIELPIARTSDFTNKFIRINKIQREVATKYPNVVYVETWDTFAPNGRFENVLPDETGRRAVVKHLDGVHLTDHGAKIMTKLLLNHIYKDIVMPE